MPNLVQLSTLRTLVRQLSSTEVDQNVTDPEVNGYINFGGGQLYDILVQTNENYRLKSASFVTATGTDTYTWATIGCTDHYKTKGVDAKLQNSTTPATVNRFEFSERNKFGVVPLPAAGASPVVAGFEYQEQDSALKFIPGTTLAAIPITLWYYPILAPLVADADTIDVVQNGWEYLPAFHAAILIKDKQEVDCTVLLGKLADLEKKIRSSAARRNQTQGHRMISSLRGPGARGRFTR